MWNSCQSCGGAIQQNEDICPHCHSELVPPDPTATWHQFFTAGRNLWKEKQYEQAVVQLSQALVEAPSDAQVARCYVARADAYLGSDNIDRAVEDATQAIQADAYFVDAYACRATALASQNKWRPAIDDHAQVIRLNPNVSAAYLNSVKKTVADALKDFDRQVAGGGNPQLFQDRGVAFALINRHDRAVSEFTQSLKAAPDDIESHLFRAKSYAALDKHKQVISDCTFVLDKGRPSADAYFARGRAFAALEKHKHAVTDLAKATKLDTSMVAAYYELGQVHETMSAVETAINAYSSGIDANPYALNCYLSRGRLLADANDHEGAVNDYSRALQLHADNPATFCRRADSYVALGFLDEAFDDYGAAIEQDPMCAEAYFGRGSAQLERQLYDSAVSELTKALRLDARMKAGYEKRGLAYLGLKKFQQAVDDLTKSLGLSSPNENTGNIQFRRGVAHQGLNAFAEALADFNDAAAQLSPSAELFQRCAHAKAGLRRWYDAVQDLDQAIALSPAEAAPFEQRQQMYHTKAVEDYTRRIERGENSPLLFRFRGLALLGLGSYDDALHDFRRALKLDDNDAMSQIGMGKILARSSSNKKAASHFSRAIRIEPEQADHYYLRGVSLMRIGQLRKALKDFNTVIRLEATHVDAHLDRSDLMIRNGKFADAAADLEVALKYSPHNPRCRLFRGRFLVARKMTEKAIEEFSASIQLDPENAAAYHARGEALKRLGKLDAAIVDFEKAIQLNSRHVDAYCSRGLCLAQQKKFETAIVELTKAAGGVRFSRKFATVYECRAQVRFLIGRYAAAVDDYTTLINLKPEGHRFDRTLCGRGLAYLKLDEKEKAIEDFKLALRLNAKYQPAQRLMDWAEGRLDEELAELRDPSVLVPFRKPPVVSEGFEIVDEGGMWNAIPLWDQWILCDAKGIEYGPNTKAMLDAWCLEGRVNDECRLLRIDQKSWLWAGDVYADLALESYRARNAPVPITAFQDETEPEEEFSFEAGSEAVSAESFPITEPPDEDDELPNIRV